MPLAGTYATTAALEAATTADLSAILAEAGKAGTFTIRAYADFVGEVAADTGKVNYIRSTSDATKTWVRASILAHGASLVGCLQGGLNGRIRTQQDKNSDIISLLDFAAAGDPDATLAFSRAVASLNAGGYKKLVIPAGNYNVASSAIAGNAFRITRDGIEIEAYGATISVTGSSTANAIFQFINCGGAIRGGKWIGNSQGSSFGSGQAIQFVCDASASVPVARAEIVDATFENFKSRSWIGAYVSHSTLGLQSVHIENNRFVSRIGNELDPNNLGQQVAFIHLQSKVSPSSGGGGIANVNITGNSGDGTYVKSGVFLSDKIQGAIVANNSFSNCGVMGAGNNAGAYAYAVYDSDQVGMRAIVLTNNVASGVRSAGLYCAGQIPGLRVRGFDCTDQTDTVSASLPKGAVVLNGCSDFVVSNVDAKNIAADVVFFVPDTALWVRGVITDISGVTCRSVVNAVSQYMKTDGLAIRRVYGRGFTDFGVGINFTPTSAGDAENWSVDDFDLETASSGATGIQIFGSSPFGGLNIRNGRIKAVDSGIRANGLTAGSITLTDISLEGNTTYGLLYVSDTTKLFVDGLVFSNVTSGYCINSSGAQGATGMSFRFHNITAGRVFNVGGNDFMRDMPTWSEVKGSTVRFLDEIAGGNIGAINVNGSSTWKFFGAIAP